MRTVLLGTTQFAGSVLERLAASPHRPALVVTRPDRPRGRGRRVQPPPVAATARELGIDLDQPEDVNSADARRRIAAARPDVVCVCAYGAILREPLLSEHPMLNVHPSLLPRWRGAAPIERAIQAGDRETGVSIIGLVEELDAGPLYLARAAPIRPDDDYGTLAPRLAALGGDLLVEVLDEPPEPRPQPEQGVTYAHKVEREERRLDPARPAREIELTVRALNPHVGTWLEHDGDRLGVRKVAAADAPSGDSGPRGLFTRGEALFLGVADGAVELLEVQPPGRRAMPAADWLRGLGPQRPPESGG